MTETTVIEKLVVALVGTKWGLEQYLVESLEEDPWKFLVRVVTEGLEQEGLFRCSECGVWTYDRLPGANVCPKCFDWQRIVGREHLHELTIALKSEGFSTQPEQPLEPHVLPLMPDMHTAHDQTVMLPDYSEDEDTLTALAGINQEANPTTATVHWDDPKVFSRWAVDRLLAALATEVKWSGAVPANVKLSFDVVRTLSPTKADEPC